MVHSNGWLADVVYGAAYPVKDVLTRLRNWRAKRDNIQAEDLYEHRHLVVGGDLIIGVTNVCNARCVFCAYPRAMDSKDLKGGVMPFILFKKIVDEWKSLGGSRIDLTHTVGDPLIDPGLVEKINYAIHQAGIKKVSFTTNGILLNKNDNYRRLIDAGVNEIYISTEGTDREMYEKVYGVKHYDDMLSGVGNLLEYNRSKGEPTSIAIRFRNAQKPSEIIGSKDFLRVIKPYFSDKVRCNFTIDFDNWGGLIKDQDLLGHMRLRHMHNNLDIPCCALFGFMVRYDGSVRLCGCRFKRTDMDDMVIGNIREQSLLDISKKAKAWEVAKGFYSGKRPETCVGCSLYHPVNRKWLNNRIAIGKVHSENRRQYEGNIPNKSVTTGVQPEQAPLEQSETKVKTPGQPTPTHDPEMVV
jgi:MoaA/NifB/PqqE/SkfB family radical SAM enzyme